MWQKCAYLCSRMYTFLTYVKSIVDGCKTFRVWHAKICAKGIVWSGKKCMLLVVYCLVLFGTSIKNVKVSYVADMPTLTYTATCPTYVGGGIRIRM